MCGIASDIMRQRKGVAPLSGFWGERVIGAWVGLTFWVRIGRFPPSWGVW